MLLSYAIYRRDPVFILGQSCGSIIYVRNLHLIHNEKVALAEAAKEAAKDAVNSTKAGNVNEAKDSEE